MKPIQRLVVSVSELVSLHFIFPKVNLTNSCRSGTPNSNLRSSIRPDDDDDDPFDPFATHALPRSFHPSASNDLWGHSPMSRLSSCADESLFLQIFGSMEHNGHAHDPPPAPAQDDDMDPEVQAMLTDGMTPFDVVSSVFGATLAHEITRGCSHSNACCHESVKRRGLSHMICY